MLPRTLAVLVLLSAFAAGEPGPGLAPRVVTAMHEMFHVYQAERGGYQKTATLDIGAANDASWQLNFPFPYKDPEVMRLIHLQGYALHQASTAAAVEDAKYALGTALDAARVYQAYLALLRPDGRFYRYSQFQEWNEGVAAYTEYRIAEAAGNSDYRPAAGFAALPGFRGYPSLWERTYRNRTFLVKHAGRAAQSRTAFYHLGMGKALALDKAGPGWKECYFDPGIWLDDLLAAAAPKQ